MFSNLSDKLQQTFKNLRGHGRLSESNITDALRDVRMALLDADVHFAVAKDFIAKVKDKTSHIRLMGFGHRVYKNYDPRAKIMQKTAHEVLTELGIKDDPLLEVARVLEQAALSDPYFIERKLYPNVDFYSGIILRALGFPTSMFTVLFALARTVGWISQWKEMIEDPGQKIGRPRQLYTGAPKRDYVPLTKRGK